VAIAEVERLEDAIDEHLLFNLNLRDVEKPRVRVMLMRFAEWLSEAKHAGVRKKRRPCTISPQRTFSRFSLSSHRDIISRDGRCLPRHEIAIAPHSAVLRRG
jgi:hypothetical protein